MGGVTVKLPADVRIDDELLVVVPNIKHGDIDLDTVSIVINDQEIDEIEVEVSLDIGKETIHVKNITDSDWEEGDVITLAWHALGQLDSV